MFVLQVFCFVTSVAVVGAYVIGGSQGFTNNQYNGLSGYPKHYGLQLSGGGHSILGKASNWPSGLHNMAGFRGGHTNIHSGISSGPFAQASMSNKVNNYQNLGRLTNHYSPQNQQLSGLFSHSSVSGLRASHQNQHIGQTNGLSSLSSLPGIGVGNQNQPTGHSNGLLSHSSLPGIGVGNQNQHTGHSNGLLSHSSLPGIGVGNQNHHKTKSSGSSYGKSSRHENILTGRISSKFPFTSEDDDDDDDHEHHDHHHHHDKGSQTSLIGSQLSGFSSHSNIDSRQTGVKDTVGGFSSGSVSHSNIGSASHSNIGSASHSNIGSASHSNIAGFNAHQNADVLRENLKKLLSISSPDSSRFSNSQSQHGGFTKQLGNSMAGSLGNVYNQHGVSSGTDDDNEFARLQTLPIFQRTFSNSQSLPSRKSHLHHRPTAGYGTGHRVAPFLPRPAQPNLFVHKHHVILHYPQVLPYYYSPHWFDEIIEIHDY